MHVTMRYRREKEDEEKDRDVYNTQARISHKKWRAVGSLQWIKGKLDLPMSLSCITPALDYFLLFLSGSIVS